MEHQLCRLSSVALAPAAHHPPIGDLAQYQDAVEHRRDEERVAEGLHHRRIPHAHHQDGSILDAITMWKENLDKQFEGVEPCIICYSVRWDSRVSVTILR